MFTGTFQVCALSRLHSNKTKIVTVPFMLILTFLHLIHPLVQLNVALLIRQDIFFIEAFPILKIEVETLFHSMGSHLFFQIVSPFFLFNFQGIYLSYRIDRKGLDHLCEGCIVAPINQQSANREGD